MLSLLSTLGGLLLSGLPKLLEYFQNKADQAHELKLAQVQTEPRGTLRVSCPVTLAQTVLGQQQGRFALNDGKNFNRGFANLAPRVQALVEHQLDDNARHNTDRVRMAIRQAAAAYKTKGNARITATGHTDTSGSEAYNMALSLRRANAVKSELVRQGVPADVIQVVERLIKGGRAAALEIMLNQGYIKELIGKGEIWVVPPGGSPAMVDRGEISDAKSILGIQWLDRLRRAGELPGFVSMSPPSPPRLRGNSTSGVASGGPMKQLAAIFWHARKPGEP